MAEGDGSLWREDEEIDAMTEQQLLQYREALGEGIYEMRQALDAAALEGNQGAGDGEAAVADQPDASTDLGALQRELRELNQEEARLKEELAETEAAAEAAEAAERDQDGADASAAAPLGSLAQEEAELRGAISRLEQEEAELRRALDSSPTLAAFREYLDDKAALEEEEAGLLTRLEEAEAVLSEVHASLTEAPADDSGASSDLLHEWKRLTAERDDLLRQARTERYQRLSEAQQKADVETALEDQETRTTLESLAQSESRYAEEARRCKERLAELEQQMRSSEESMAAFRSQFDQLRVALMLDKTVKNAHLAALRERRAKLEEATAWFRRALEAETQKVLDEEKQAWDERLEEERAKAREQLEAREREAKAKMEGLRHRLEKRYEEGFQPVIAKAREQTERESEQVEKLKEEVARLERLVDKAKRIQQPRGHRGEDLGGPARTRELLSEVTELWDELETPLKERADFLAAADMAGPFSVGAYNLYAGSLQDMSRGRRLSVG